MLYRVLLVTKHQKPRCLLATDLPMEALRTANEANRHLRDIGLDSHRVRICGAAGKKVRRRAKNKATASP